MSERDRSAEEVRREHLAEVQAPVQALYLVGVIVGASVIVLTILLLLSPDG